MKANASEPGHFDRHYLAALTRAGVKPLSRWEAGWTDDDLAALHAAGLHARRVPRPTTRGRTVEELVFSRSDASVSAYARRFAGQPVSRDPAARRDEGRAFGYPACCVESFLAHGYQANHLRPSDQGILFHWACPGCAETPRLLPAYRAILRECRRTWRAAGHRVTRPRRGLAAGLALAGVLPWALAHAELDPHQVPLGTADSDGDFLLDVEEIALGRQPTVSDDDGNGRADGLDLAQAMAAAIAHLPDHPVDSGPYVEAHALRGLETCAVCGATVNMGHLTVCHPSAGLYVRVPYIGIHALEHGSASYAGDVHGRGRLELPLLWRTLTTTAPTHAPVLEDDRDHDGLGEFAERHFAADPTRADSDTDGVPDGFAVARQVWQAIEDLPRQPDPEGYRIDRPMFGSDPCPTCGVAVGMGEVEILHPAREQRLTMTYLQVHYLEHGSFAVPGGPSVEPEALEGVLRPGVVLDLGTGARVVTWHGRSGRHYQVHWADGLTGPWMDGPSYLGEDRVLHFTDEDPPTRATRFYRITVR